MVADGERDFVTYEGLNTQGKRVRVTEALTIRTARFSTWKSTSVDQSARGRTRRTRRARLAETLRGAALGPCRSETVETHVPLQGNDEALNRLDESKDQRKRQR